MGSSRLSGFFKMPLEARRRMLGLAPGEASDVDLDALDRSIENVIGAYTLPFAVALNFRVDGRDVLVPMVTEEPSVVAAASKAALLARELGGFQTEADPSWVCAQVQLLDVADVPRARAAIEAKRGELVALANGCVPRLVARGGGARSLEVRVLSEGMLVVETSVDC